MSSPEDVFESKGERFRLAILRGPELDTLLPLFDDAFGAGRLTADSLRKKYAYDLHGLTGFVCVAFSADDEPVGAVGVLPWPARFDDHVEPAGQMVDVATASAYRGRGLFVRLAEMAREVCEDSGVGFLYGYPNEAAYPIWMNKLGYEHIGDLAEHRLAVHTLPVQRVARRVGALRRLYDGYAERMLGEARAGPAFESSVLAAGDAGIEHDESFYAYKREAAGSRVVEVPGGRAWVRVARTLLVGDLQATSDEEVTEAMRALGRLATRLGVGGVQFIASGDERFSHALASGYQHARGLPVIYRNIRSEIPRERLRFTFGDLDNF